MKNYLVLYFVFILLLPLIWAKTNPRQIIPKNQDAPQTLPKGQNVSVLIIGGTPSGLSAALELSSRGFQVTIVEAGDVLGGDYGMRLVETSKGPFSSYYLPRHFEEVFTNAYQTQNLLDRLNLKANVTWTDYVHIASPNKLLRSVQGTSPSAWFYTKLQLSFVRTSSCLTLSDFTSSVKVQHSLAGMADKDMLSRYSNFTLKELKKELGDHENFYECFLHPFSSGTGLGHEGISAYAALNRMLYFATSNSYGVKNSQVTFNVLDDKTNLVSQIVEKLRQNNVRFITNHGVAQLNVDGPHGRVLGDFSDKNTTYDFVILATDVDTTLEILTTTKHKNNGAPKIFRPIQDALNHMNGLRKAPPMKVANIWLNKPIVDTKHSVIVLSGFDNVERISVLHHFSQQLTALCAKNATSVIQVLLRNCTSQTCQKSNLWKTIFSQVGAAIPSIQSAQPLDIVITDLVGGVHYGLHEEKKREKVDFIKRLGLPNLILGGNWLATNDYPSYGLERDLSLGREAANAVLLDSGVRQVSLFVPLSIGEGFWGM
jgi:uncharacterized protein with NAD-binding domain and iron-sulfur cluster